MATLEADLLLLPDHFLDLAVLHLLELRRGDLAFFVLGARFLEWLAAQDAADMVGAKGRS